MRATEQPDAAPGNDADRVSGRPLVGVGAVLLSRDLQRVLLVERGSPPAQGSWSVPGGLVERGETLREACARELFEETGLIAELRGEVKVLERILGRETAVRYHFLIVDFWGHPLGESEPCAGSDARRVRWVAVDEVAALEPTTWGLAEVVTRALQLARGLAPATPLFAASRIDELD